MQRRDKLSFRGEPEGPMILKCEIAAALKAMKKRKEVGSDKIATEMIDN